MKLVFTSIALLLTVGILAGGCKQLEGLLGEEQGLSRGDDEISGAGESRHVVLPSNPVPGGTSVTAGVSEGNPDAPPDRAAESARAAEPDGLAGAEGASSSEPSERLYTAHNLWYLGSDAINAMNYKSGRMLPAGTPVTNVEVINRRFERDRIKFTTPKDGVNFSIVWDANNHPGWSLVEIKDRLITTKTFEELTQGFQAFEIEAIREGSLRAGMSRRAVLVAYGYPPALSTPNLNSSLWKYWVASSRFISVRFDRSGRTVEGPGVKAAGS